MIWVSESTVKDVAASGPKVTALAPVKPSPVMTTLAPPDAGPADGVNDVMAVGARTAWSSDEALIRPAPQVLLGVDASHTPPGKLLAFAGSVIRAST